MRVTYPGVVEQRDRGLIHARVVSDLADECTESRVEERLCPLPRDGVVGAGVNLSDDAEAPGGSRGEVGCPDTLRWRSRAEAAYLEVVEVDDFAGVTERLQPSTKRGGCEVAGPVGCVQVVTPTASWSGSGSGPPEGTTMTAPSVSVPRWTRRAAPDPPNSWESRFWASPSGSSPSRIAAVAAGFTADVVIGAPTVRIEEPSPHFATASSVYESRIRSLRSTATVATRVPYNHTSRSVMSLQFHHRAEMPQTSQER